MTTVAYDDFGANVVHWNHYRSDAPEPGEDVGYGSFYEGMEDGEPAYIEIPYCSFSDYSGSCIERSNLECILDDYRDFVILAEGGYGTRSLFLRVGTEIPEELHEAIEGLREYPLYSEEAHTMLEFELEREDWEGFARDDLKVEIEQRLEEMLDDEQASLAIELLDNDRLDAAYREASQDGAVYWEAETAVGGYFHGLDTLVDDVATALGLEVLNPMAARFTNVPGQLEIGA